MFLPYLYSCFPAIPEIMKTIKDAPADACSGLWFDYDDKLLVAYFANHITSVSGLCKLEFF
jgi:hypothetical protein